MSAGRPRRFGPALLALAGGAAAAAAHPPMGWLPGLFGHALVLLALQAPGGERWGSAFRRGWAAGTGYMAVSTLWIAEPFLIDAAQHAWQIPFAMGGMAAGVGLLWGVGGLLLRLLVRPGASVTAATAAYAAAFGAAEWLRGHVLTGFPWDLVGETFRAGSPLSQGAALVGAYGLTPVALFIGAAPAALAGRGGARRLAAPAAAAALVAALGVWGAWRLAALPPAPPGAPVVRVVQPDLPEPPAWTPEVLDRALDRYGRLSRTPAAGAAPTLVIWPEGALPASLNETLTPGGPIAVTLADAVAPGAVLILGGARAEAGPDARWFNTLAVLRRDRDGLRLAGLYDKHHLVPFGEYLPLASVLGRLGLRKLVSVGTDFAPGPPPRPLRLPDGSWAQPLVCYEALFPGLARRRGGPRPRLLVNISDDAWFGRDMGPWQHLNLASYRAIEEGLPMARATPTGVSAVIDAGGRPVQRLPTGRVGVLDAPLPVAAAPTAYARWGELGLLVLELAAAGAALCLTGDTPRWRPRRGQANSRGGAAARDTAA